MLEPKNESGYAMNSNMNAIPKLLRFTNTQNSRLELLESTNSNEYGKIPKAGRVNENSRYPIRRWV